MVEVALYTGILAAAAAVQLLAGRLRLPAPPLLIGLGLLLGRGGLELFPPKLLLQALGGVEVHLAVLLLALGFRLGRGHLRLPLPAILRRSLPPFALAAGALLVSALALPHLLPDPAAKQSFVRFYVPQAFVLAVYALLAVRDLRGRPPADVGSLFLAAILLVGAVHSFTPSLLWAPVLDPGVLWRGPVLILGESGALGVAGAVTYLAATRALRLPRGVTGLLALGAVVAFASKHELWAPFAGLGFGIALGRTNEPEPRLPSPRWEARAAGAIFSEAPFLLLVGLAFAPDLYFDSVLIPSIVLASWLAAILLTVRARVPGGRELVTGPGLLFLALTLTVRLDNRMSPITRSTVDLALPAWILLRGGAALAGGLRRGRERRSSPPRPPRTAARRTLR